jgi:hypothetical protein
MHFVRIGGRKKVLPKGDLHGGWWRLILSARRNAGDSAFTICREVGPAPCMRAIPITQEPPRRLMGSRYSNEELVVY